MSTASTTADAKKRTDITRKIKALLSMTVERGATESEAMAAMVTARKLMDDYQIELNDLEGGREDGFERIEVKADTFVLWQIRLRLSGGVAHYCDVKSWCDGSPNKLDGKNRVTFFGKPNDVKFADWLGRYLELFIVRGAKEYMASERSDCWVQDDMFGGGKVKPKEAKSRQSNEAAKWAFVVGALERITKRLHEEAYKRKAAFTGKNQLMVRTKGALIDAELARLGYRFQSGSLGTLSQRDSAALAAGIERGNSANFGRPIEGGGDGAPAIALPGC